MLSRSRSALAAGAAVLVLGVTAAGASAAGPTTYTGTVTAGTGHHATLRADVSVLLTGFFAPVPSGVLPAGTFTAAFTGTNCVHAKRCLTGTVTGHWSTKRVLPDVGNTVTLNGAGRLTGLGRVTLTGTGQGPGLIASAQPILTVRLRTPSRGSVRVTALAPAVPGFTSFF